VRIRGGAEGRAVAALLGKKVEGEELVIYRPELREVRRRLPTTTYYLFLP